MTNGESGDDKLCSLFCQLNEFSDQVSNRGRWYERARWVKFEEIVENTKEHWSKPHVGILSLKSIFKFRSIIENAVISLNLEAENLDQILTSILKLAVKEEKLDSALENELKQLLIMSHFNPHHNRSGLGSQTSLLKTGSNNDTKNKKKFFMKDFFTSGDLKIDEDKLSEHKFCSKYKKKIPVGSEVANILVAELEHLNEDLYILIRLQKSFIIGAYSEVNLPTRFILILLGPCGQLSSLHECGRVAGSIFADNIFRQSVYKAAAKEDILNAIDEFINSALVIPPDEWNPDEKIDPPKGIIPERFAANKVDSEDAIDEIEAEVEKEEELKCTGRFFGGFIDDLKRKKVHYLSDFVDAFNLQCISTFIFLYFACLAPTITFGGLLLKATDGYMAAIESLLAAAIVGIVYSLFSGQPLTILGTTGPLLIFETIIFKICGIYNWDFLPFRFWIGFWIMIILIIVVAFDLCVLVKYFTKFTEECFAMLISLIYIVKAFQKLFDLLEDYPVNRNWNPNYVLNRTCSCIPPNKTIMETSTEEHAQRLLKFEKPPLLPGYVKSNKSILYFIDWDNITDGYFSWKTHDFKQMCVDYGGTWVGNTCGKLYVPDIFYFSWILMLGTFTVAFGLKLFRNSDMLPNKVREIIGTFAVVIAIFVFTLFDILVGMNTPKLVVPDKLEPTLGYGIRTWVVPFLGKNPWWMIPLAFIPALLAVILIFMDQQITVIIVNRKSNKLKKGYGYHLDMFVIAIMIGINSLLGMPWFVGSTVLAMNHVMSLKIQSSNNVPGVAPVFLGCREQRVTSFLISLAIGLSVFFTPMLQRIPMPVLYGVFFYMGVSPLSEIEMIQRIRLFFINVKKRPDYKYLQYIPIKRVHLFTLVQVVCLIILISIKSIDVVSVSFPLMVLAMCFVRKSLECVFSTEELIWLDNLKPKTEEEKKSSKSKCLPCCRKREDKKEEEFELNLTENVDKEESA